MGQPGGHPTKGIMPLSGIHPAHHGWTPADIPGKNLKPMRSSSVPPTQFSPQTRIVDTVPAIYRGRLAPTPTGFLHIGHAATFWTAFQRASGGAITLRIEDLDPRRCRTEFVQAAIEDLRWLGISWDREPVFQSARRHLSLDAWRRLRDGGWIYPCRRSRKDVENAVQAPHHEEPLFPVAWRTSPDAACTFSSPDGVNWRFRVPDECISFHDENLGYVERVGQKDFGDFVVWNRENIPAYELAVVVDDLAMGITEVVRGADLLTSTARQLLIMRALDSSAPTFFHCPLLVDSSGRRLSKREGGLAIRNLRDSGLSPVDVLLLAAQSQCRSFVTILSPSK